MCNLILLELNIFLKKYYTKPGKNQLLIIYLVYKMMSLLCEFYIAFIEDMLGKKLP